MGQPDPVVVALANTDLELLLFDFDLQEHLNKFLSEIKLKL